MHALTHADAFKRCLVNTDVTGLKALWAHVFPHLHQPADDEQALIMLHHARTQAESVRFRLRAYSHAWLTERALPSGLPDRLRPRAERIYPRIVEGVGISVRARSPEMAPLADAVHRAMQDAVEDAYAEGRTDPVFVRKRMFDARAGVRQKLLGIRPAG